MGSGIQRATRIYQGQTVALNEIHTLVVYIAGTAGIVYVVIN
jgi:ribosomal protein L27